jgi:hypothetical protein
VIEINASDNEIQVPADVKRKVFDLTVGIVDRERVENDDIVFRLRKAIYQ